MKLRYIPNIITVARLFLVLPFAYFVLNEHYPAALYVFFLAGLSDGIDGVLARHFNWTSEFGAFMDPLADKLLMFTSYGLMAWIDAIPLWLFLIVVLRDIIIISGVGGVMYIRGKVSLEPFLVSKINTACQLLLILMVLFELAFYPLPDHWLKAVMVVVVILTILSVLAYIWEGTLLSLGYRKPRK